jgi:hypothetical protein
LEHVLLIIEACWASYTYYSETLSTIIRLSTDFWGSIAIGYGILTIETSAFLQIIIYGPTTLRLTHSLLASLKLFHVVNLSAYSYCLLALIVVYDE